MTLTRRAYTTEEQLVMLIEGLTKLQTKIAAGERVNFAVEFDGAPLVPMPRNKKSQSSAASRLLNIEGGYVPGKYALADWLAEQKPDRT